MEQIENLEELKFEDEPDVSENILSTVEQLVAPKVHGFAVAEFSTPTTNPWTDALKAKDKKFDYEEFVKINSLCRFFYRTEPVVSTVINKLVEIGINDLMFSKNKLTDNEFRVYTSIKPRLLEFGEQLAQEYMLSGLVVPEVGYSKNNDKNYIFSLGIKKYTSLILPESLTLRDPKNIKIYTHLLGDKPSYYIKVPTEIIEFIKNKGVFGDGKENKELYDMLVNFYPDFVKQVNSGLTEVPLENNLIIRRKYTSDNPYPIPYISPSLDALQHKRKLRRMDYSLIDKVISAILHVRVGNDTFPQTDTEEDQLSMNELRTQLRMRGNSEQLMERIFQLITNHTVEMEWIFPNMDVLVNTEKYSDINQEILFGLGFPRVLITGESQRSGSSDPELAMIAPIKTMENFRSKIIEVIRNICNEVALRNNFKSAPTVEFKALSLHSFSDFITGISKLYDASAMSRTDLGKVYGVDFLEQVDKLEQENVELTSRGLPTFGPTPFGSNTDPQSQGKVETKPKSTPEAKKSGKVVKNEAK